MKFLCERDKLQDALGHVTGHTKGQRVMPILAHVLIEADDSALSVTGHDLVSCSSVTVAAEVEAPGAVAVPADRLARLVAGLSSGGQVSVSCDGQAATVKAGRSLYQFSVMPSEDFPAALQSTDPVTFSVPAEDIRKLFKTPSNCINQTQDRIYLNGIYLHVRKSKLAGCATNGHTLLLATTNIKPPAFDGVIVPDEACDEIVRLVGDAAATVEVSRQVIAVSANGRRFASKLIDGTFPDYQRVIPQRTAPRMVVETDQLDEALARLFAAHDAETSRGVRLTWDRNPSAIVAKVRSQVAEGSDEIECDSQERDAGEVGCNIDYLRDLLGALGGERATIYIAGPGDPIRVENPDDDSVVAVLMPMRA